MGSLVGEKTIRSAGVSWQEEMERVDEMYAARWDEKQMGFCSK